MTSSTLSSKNQIVVPTEVRKRLGVKNGDKIIYVAQPNGSYLISKQPTVYDLMGILGPSQGDPVKRIRKIRDDWDDKVNHLHDHLS